MCQNILLMSWCLKLNTKLTFLSKRRLLSTSRVVNAAPSPTARAVNANFKSIIVNTLLDVFFSNISAAHASTGQRRFFQIFTNPASSISFILKIYWKEYLQWINSSESLAKNIIYAFLFVNKTFRCTHLSSKYCLYGVPSAIPTP